MKTFSLHTIAAVFGLVVIVSTMTSSLTFLNAAEYDSDFDDELAQYLTDSP